MIELRVGSKVIHIYVSSFASYAMTDCHEFGQVALVKVELTPVQAARLINRTEDVQDILPEVPKEVREIFNVGITPAEWDATMNGRRRHWRYYQKEMGYVFYPEDAGTTTEEMDKHDDRNGYKR